MSWQIDIPKKVVIIGGMAAGCKAGARLARLLPECEITVVEKSEMIAMGKCGMPLYASGDINDLSELAKTPWGVVQDPTYFRNAKGVEVLNLTEAIEIDHNNKIVKCQNLQSNQEIDLQYNALVLATGTRQKTTYFSYPETPRIRFFNRPEDAISFRKLANTGEIGSAVIIGGGYIGVELAESMVDLWGIETTILEKESHLMSEQLDEKISEILGKKVKENNVALECNTEVSKLEVTDDDQIKISLDDGETLQTDFVFITTGLQPETTLAQSLGLQLGSNGGIIVDEQMHSSVKEIWASGDCVEVKNLVIDSPGWFPFGSLANRQGRVAADSIAHRKERFPGSVGTSSVKVFDFTIATAGINEKQAQQQGIDFLSVWGTFPDRPHYHPDKKNLFTKILYEPKSQRILGIQMAGEGEICRYVDVVSALMPKKLTATDLLELEHAYMPAHSGPMSPLNQLGALIISQDVDDVRTSEPDLSTIGDDIILDVRMESEHEEEPLPGNVFLIPQDQLRDRISELDLSKPIHTVCKQGPRAYQAARFLKDKGADKVDYVGGGSTMLLVDQDDDKINKKA